MQTNETYYIAKIKEGLSIKQRKNPQYSLRSYARDLAIHPSTLSQVLKKTRPLPIKNSYHVVEKLELSPKERTLFLESLFKTKTALDDIEISESDERFMLDESYYRVIAEWEHYAVLTLFDLKKFKGTISEISERLGCTENRAEVVVDNLLTSGLLITDTKGVLKKRHAQLRTTEDISSQALRQSHKENLDIGKQKLDEVEVTLRDFSAMTVAVDLEKITEAKTIIREFRQKMSALLVNGNKTEVYQLAIQFYPLTKQKIKR